MTSSMRIGASTILAGLLLAAGPVQAQLEGSLFTRPEERAYLDYLRRDFLRRSQQSGFDIEGVEIPEIPDDAVTQTGPVEFSFGGLMTRRDGSHSVWLNGHLLNESDLPEGVKVVAGANSLSLSVAYEGIVYLLRPGQSVNVTTRTISEAWQRARGEAAAPAADPAVPAATSESGTGPAPGAAQSTSGESGAGNAGIESADGSDSEAPRATDAETTLADTLSNLSQEEMTALSNLLESRQQAEDEDP